LLRADNSATAQLFIDYDNTHSSASKKELVNEICKALSVLAQVKEEVFYPEAKALLQDGSPERLARVERAGVGYLIAQLQGVEPHGETCDATVRVLSEVVKRNVREEQDGMFPPFSASSLDMIDVGARMAARQADLLDQAANDSLQLNGRRRSFERPGQER
jgi:hypothetical protein